MTSIPANPLLFSPTPYRKVSLSRLSVWPLSSSLFLTLSYLICLDCLSSAFQRIFLTFLISNYSVSYFLISPSPLSLLTLALTPESLSRLSFSPLTLQFFLFSLSLFLYFFLSFVCFPVLHINSLSLCL